MTLELLFVLECRRKYSTLDVIYDVTFCAWAMKLRCGENKRKWCKCSNASWVLDRPRHGNTSPVILNFFTFSFKLLSL